jgi:hypothetical protein
VSLGNEPKLNATIAPPTRPRIHGHSIPLPPCVLNLSGLLNIAQLLAKSAGPNITQPDWLTVPRSLTAEERPPEQSTSLHFKTSSCTASLGIYLCLILFDRVCVEFCHRYSTDTDIMARRGSKKSRKGCKRCKEYHAFATAHISSVNRLTNRRRRVKCDQGAPCANCVRRQEECSLLDEEVPSDISPLDPALPWTSDAWVADLELMHHYTQSKADKQWFLAAAEVDLHRHIGTWRIAS